MERLSKLIRATQLVSGQGETQAVSFSIPQEITKNKEASKFFPPTPTFSNVLQVYTYKVSSTLFFHLQYWVRNFFTTLPQYSILYLSHLIPMSILSLHFLFYHQEAQPLNLFRTRMAGVILQSQCLAQCLSHSVNSICILGVGELSLLKPYSISVFLQLYPCSGKAAIDNM